MCQITHLSPWQTLPYAIWAWKRLAPGASGPVSWTHPWQRAHLALPNAQGRGQQYHYARRFITRELPGRPGLFCFYSLWEVHNESWEGPPFCLPSNTWLIAIPKGTKVRRAWNGPEPVALLTRALVPLEPVDAFFPDYTTRTNYQALRKWAQRTFHAYQQKEHNHA